MGGIEKKRISRPLMTASVMRQRESWCSQRKTLSRNRLIRTAFLDEKWFYTSSKRKTLKVLKAQEGEDQARTREKYLRRPESSRRHVDKASIFFYLF